MQRAGKNVVDMVQIWQREHLRWDVLKMRDFTVTYGCCAFVAGQLLTPFLLRVTSARAFTSFANLTNLTGFLMRDSDYLTFECKVFKRGYDQRWRGPCLESHSSGQLRLSLGR